MKTARERDDLDVLVDSVIDVYHADREPNSKIAIVSLLAELVRTARELVEQQKIANDIADQALSDTRNTRMRGP